MILVGAPVMLLITGSKTTITESITFNDFDSLLYILLYILNII